MSRLILNQRFAVLGICLCLFGAISPGIALACEGETEETEAVEDPAKELWEARWFPFHEVPKADQKRLVTVELMKGGPEKIKSFSVGKPANFAVTNPFACEKNYTAGTSCQIEMEFKPAGKGNGKYFGDLELNLQGGGTVVFPNAPSGTIP
jgi:hypothetical protein